MNEKQEELLRAEEQKRETAWDTRERRRAILATLRWASAQRTVKRNTSAACRAEENRKLAALAKK